MSHWKQVTFEKGYSQREENIVYNSFRYVKNAPHPKEPTQYWKCAYKGCLSRAKTNKDDHTIGYINHAEHSHLPDIIKRKIEGIRHDFNLKAVATLDTPKSIIVSSKSNLGPETLARMPHDTSISRSIRRSRKSDEFTDPELRVQQAMEIILPDELTITSQGSRFLLYDSITDDTMKDIKHRALVFISNKGLHSLVQAPNWSCDGTFRLCPKNFYQYFVIGVVVNKKSIPIVHCLLTGKTKFLYMKVFNAIKNHLPANFQPTSIISDFELAALLAIIEIFDRTVIVGCFFHLGQNFTRKAFQIGLKPQFNEPEIYLHFRMCMALAFLPTALVVQGFRIILVTGLESMAGFFEYIARVYVGLTLDEFERGVDAFIEKTTLANPQNFIDNDPYMKEPIEINPNFPIDLWNVRNRIADALPFTNNSLEAYHGNLQKAHDRVKQPFDLFINLIIKEEAARETQLTQLLVKPYEGKQKKQYRINSEQASALVKNHPLDNNQQILAFLKAVAFHLMNFEYYAEVGAAEDEYCHDT